MKYILTIILLTLKQYFLLFLIAFKLFLLILLYPYNSYKNILRNGNNNTYCRGINQCIKHDKVYDCDYILFNRCIINLDINNPILLNCILHTLSTNIQIMNIFNFLNLQITPASPTIIIRLYSTEEDWIEIKFYPKSLDYHSIRKCLIDGLNKKYVNTNLILYYDLVIVNRVIT